MFAADFNTIRLLKGEERLSRREFEKFTPGDTIFGGVDLEPVEVKRWSMENKDLALAELANLKCTYDRGPELIYVTEYALEYCECDEDGKFVEGSDYDLAEIEKEE